ncbi:MAG: protein kinase, partial [Myxococcales bacterium]|nr:protein kinase [Myxococcales bacterium]
TDTTDTTDGTGCADVCGTPGCGQCPAVDMVAGPGFSIDAIETPIAAYALFVTVPFSPDLLHADCDWKTSFLPDDW